MSKNNFFKWMLVAMFGVVAMAFTGCKEDEDTGLQAPELSLSTQSLTFDEQGGYEAVQVTANCMWQVASKPEWVTVTPTKGDGNGTIEVSVGEATAARSGEISFTLIHATYGPWGKAEQKISIVQTVGGEAPITEAVYSNNFDKEEATKTYGSDGTYWPYLDQFDGWQNQQGSGAETVAYSYNGMSARNNSNSNGSYSDYAGSGKNNLLFGSEAYFQIENITLPATLNYELSFGAEKYSQDYGSIFSTDEFTVTLSADGTKWSAPLTLTHNIAEARWNVATAHFTLPEGTTTLWIKFAASVKSAYRLDDVLLSAAQSAGEAITFDGSDSPVTPPTGETVEMTIPEVIAKCVAAGSTQTALNSAANVVVYGVVVPDKAAGNTVSKNLPIMTEGATEAGNGILLYGSGITDPANESYNFEAGDKVKVTLAAGLARVVTYNGVYEVTGSTSDTWCTIEKVGTAEITPIKITVDELADYQSMVVELENVTSPATSQTWTTADNYKTHTFTVDGKDLTIYVQKGAADFVGKAYAAGKTGSLKGYVTLYQGNPQIMPRTAADVADFTDENAEPEPDPEVEKGQFARVTTLTPGKQYVLVGETGSVYAALNASFINTGSGSTPDVVEVTPVDGVIEMPMTAAVTIEETAGGYTLKGSKGYLTYPGDGTKIISAETATTWTATADNGVYTIADATVTDRAILCRYDADYKRFGAYKTSNLGNGYYGVVLYELNGTAVTPDPEDPEQPEDPVTPGEVIKATVAEFLAAAEDDTQLYELTGTITSVTNTTYGNFYLKDETGEVLIYGLCSPEGESKYWATAGVKVGDTITVQTIRTSYNGTAQGKNALYVSHEAGTTEEPEDPVTPGEVIKATVAEFLAAAEDATIYELTGTITGTYNTQYGNFYLEDETGKVQVYGLLSPEGESKVQYTAAGLQDGYKLTIQGTRTSFNGTAQMSNATYVSHEVVEVEKPDADLTAKNDDFNTLTANSSYGTYTTVNGWKGENCSVFEGGSADSAPVFKSLLGEDASVKGLTMNGKTSAVGKITSPVLPDGCGTLSLNYGYCYSEANGVSFKVEIIQDGAAVQSYDVVDTTLAQHAKGSWSREVNVTGDFQIVITNNSPSNNGSKNKDRFTVFNIAWTAAE